MSLVTRRYRVPLAAGTAALIAGFLVTRSLRQR